MDYDGQYAHLLMSCDVTNGYIPPKSPSTARLGAAKCFQKASHQAGRNAMLKLTDRVLKLFIGVAVFVAMSGTAWAGPPLICHPFDAGSSVLLPWGSGSGWSSADTSYDVQRVVADTLRLLSPNAPILARMENMRRATIYAGKDPKVA